MAWCEPNRGGGVFKTNYLILSLEGMALQDSYQPQLRISTVGLCGFMGVPEKERTLR